MWRADDSIARVVRLADPVTFGAVQRAAAATTAATALLGSCVVDDGRRPRLEGPGLIDGPEYRRIPAESDDALGAIVARAGGWRGGWPLWRVYLAGDGDDYATLGLEVCHAICDGRSVNELVRTFARALRHAAGGAQLGSRALPASLDDVLKEGTSFGERVRMLRAQAADSSQDRVTVGRGERRTGWRTAFGVARFDATEPAGGARALAAVARWHFDVNPSDEAVDAIVTVDLRRRAGFPAVLSALGYGTTGIAVPLPRPRADDVGSYAESVVRPMLRSKLGGPAPEAARILQPVIARLAGRGLTFGRVGVSAVGAVPVVDGVEDVFGGATIAGIPVAGPFVFVGSYRRAGYVVTAVRHPGGAEPAATEEARAVSAAVADAMMVPTRAVVRGV